MANVNDNVNQLYLNLKNTTTQTSFLILLSQKHGTILRLFWYVEFLPYGILKVNDIFTLGETKESELQKFTDLTPVIHQIKIPLLSLKMTSSMFCIESAHDPQVTLYFALTIVMYSTFWASPQNQAGSYLLFKWTAKGKEDSSQAVLLIASSIH